MPAPRPRFSSGACPTRTGSPPSATLSPSRMLPEMPKAISAIYVSDMARAKNWDQPEARHVGRGAQASFVIGSRRRSGMDTDEAIPFGEDAAARTSPRPTAGGSCASPTCPNLHPRRRGVMRPATRRRFIAITAAAGGLPLLSPRPARAAPLLRVWREPRSGRCDAPASPPRPDRRGAADRGERSPRSNAWNVMSLYEPDSALLRLNRDGVLDDPPFDLVRVLSESALWRAHRRRVRRDGAAAVGSLRRAFLPAGR